MNCGFSDKFPLGAQELADRGVEHRGVLSGHHAPLLEGAHHEGPREPLHMVWALLVAACCNPDVCCGPRGFSSVSITLTRQTLCGQDFPVSLLIAG